VDNAKLTAVVIRPRKAASTGRPPLRFPAPTAVLMGVFFWITANPERPSRPAPRLVLDINTAPPRVISALPTIGPARLAAIELERSSSPFRSLADLEKRVKGIGPASAAALAPSLRFGPEPPPR